MAGLGGGEREEDDEGLDVRQTRRDFLRVAAGGAWLAGLALAGGGPHRAGRGAGARGGAGGRGSWGGRRGAAGGSRFWRGPAASRTGPSGRWPRRRRRGRRGSTARA